MKKFLKICSELKKNSTLNYRKVQGWFGYLQHEANANRYYPIELIKVPKQIAPALMLSFE